MIITQAILVCAIGLVVGSFLNVVIFRLHAGTSFLGGRSHCPHCRKTLHVSHLIPLVSYLALRGRCAFCRKRISPQYPLVEAATAALFVAFIVIDGLSWEFAFHAVMSAFLIVLFVYDLRYMLVPDSVSLPAAALALAGSLALGMSFRDAAIGGILGGGFFLLQYAVSRGKWIGGGDIRIGLLIGFLLGWPIVLVALGMAYIVGAAVGVALILTKAKTWKSQIAFGTFLTASAVAILLWQSFFTELLRAATL